jgi:hypothetical protein
MKHPMPPFADMYTPQLKRAVRNYADGNTTVDEFIDAVFEAATKGEVHELFYGLINRRHDYRTECEMAMKTSCTKKMTKAYANMMVYVRVLTTEDTL